MNAGDIRLAVRVWSGIGERAKAIAKTELASRVRTTGWDASLRWLMRSAEAHKDGTELGLELCDALGIPSAPAERGRRSNVELLSDGRRALALAEALHLHSRSAANRA